MFLNEMRALAKERKSCVFQATTCECVAWLCPELLVWESVQFHRFVIALLSLAEIAAQRDRQ